MKPNRPLYERVLTHVENSRLSVSELAHLADWSEQKTYRKLHGRTRWLAEDMEVLARLLNKSVGALYRDTRSRA